MRISITIDSDQIDEVISRLEDATDSVAILDEASALLLNRIRTRFLREESPDGPWLPSKAATKRRSGGGSGTLFDTGNLFRSVQTAGTGPNERKILTDVEYGIYHHEGTALLPPRVFLGFNDNDADLVERLIIKRVREALT